MKKLKTIFLAVTMLLAGALFGITSNATETTVPEDSGIEAYAASEGEIENYIAGKTAQGQFFFEYDTIVNRSYEWTSDYGTVDYEIEGDTFKYFDNSLWDTYTFKKGYAYLINAAIPNLTSYNNGYFDAWDLENSKVFLSLYNLNILNNRPDGIIWEGCDFIELYDDEVNYEWDNTEICSTIKTEWRNRIGEIYHNILFGNNRRPFQSDGDPVLFVPSEDYTITLDSSKIDSSYTGMEAYIFSGKLMESDYIPPIFEGTVNLAVNVDSQPSIENILSNIRAIDETDGVLPVVLESSTYEPGVMEVGHYTIVVSATDNAGNKGTQSVDVYRFDNTVPVITGQSNYILNYDHNLTLNDIKANLVVTDNVDNNLSLNVVSDNFSANKNTLGTYQIVFNAVDLSSNRSANKTVTLTVENQGYSVITAPKEITVTISKQLSLDELKSRILVSDGYDGTITNYSISGFDEYTNSWGTTGENEITISYKNSGANLTTAVIKIIKVDDKVPGFFFNSGYFVMLSPGERFDLTQFKNAASAVLQINIEDIVDVSGDWDTETPGAYSVMLLLADGTEEDFVIRVGEQEPEEVRGFTWGNFFSANNYWQNLFNYPNYAEWCIAIWATYLGVAGVIIFFVYRKWKKGSR